MFSGFPRRRDTVRHVLHNGAKQFLTVGVQASTKTLQKCWDREGIARQADGAPARFSKIVDDIVVVIPKNSSIPGGSPSRATRPGP